MASGQLSQIDFNMSLAHAPWKKPVYVCVELIIGEPSTCGIRKWMMENNMPVDESH